MKKIIKLYSNNEVKKAKHYNRKVYKCKVFKMINKEIENQISDYLTAA